MKDILNYIPGFRSGVKWKKIIALIYYLFSLATLTEGFTFFIMFLVLPFVVFSFADLFKLKGESRIVISKAVFKLIIFLIIFNISVANMPETNNKVSRDIRSTVSVEASENKDIDKKAEIDKKKQEESKKAEADKKAKDALKVTTAVSGQLKVHYINVGQADSILIQQGNASMLIDAGNNADSNTVKNYISSQGITKLDYVIGTHPHEDHIGGLDYIINNFQIGKIYMPKATSTTKTFNDVIAAIKNKGMQITTPVSGDSFKLGEATCTIVAPNGSSYENLNNYSIVIKITFGSNSFMFDGDAEAVSEMEIVKKGFDIKADVLKIGHHGSNSSTCANFLDKVNPKYAVISVGEGNKYKHPHKGTMDRLQSKGITVYRTDECGTIVCTSDGKNISFNVDPGDYKYNGNGSSAGKSSSSSSKSNSTPPVVVPVPAASTSTQNSNDSNKTVYWTPGGKSYHYDRNCRTLKRSKTINEGSLSGCTKSDACNICAGGR